MKTQSCGLPDELMAFSLSSEGCRGGVLKVFVLTLPAPNNAQGTGDISIGSGIARISGEIPGFISFIYWGPSKSSVLCEDTLLSDLAF